MEENQENKDCKKRKIVLTKKKKVLLIAACIVGLIAIVGTILFTVGGMLENEITYKLQLAGGILTGIGGVPLVLIGLYFYYI